jgi:hypothetical protein
MNSAKKYVFDKPITEIVKQRTSVRSYEPEALEEKVKEKLITFLKEVKGPFNEGVRFKLVDSKSALNSDIKLGTYGIIRGASSFAVSAVEKGDMYLEELGYRFEKFVLYVASLGLGTCWLGGTFKKGEFSKAVELKENEILPIVIPVGYPAKNKSLVEKLMRKVAGSNNRKPWEEIFFKGDFDKKLSMEEAGSYSEALEMLRLAPSASNKQPWRVVKDGNNLHFYICHAKGYSTGLGFDMQRIDIGIGMCHLDLALKESGMNGSWQKLNPNIKVPDETIEYEVSWVKQ